MKRREFVWLSIATSASLSLSFYSCRQTDAALQNALAQPQMLGRICDQKTLQEIGKAYRKLKPGEDNENKLQSLLLKNNRQATTPEALHKMLEQQIKRDFETAQMVKVNGWILSATEARQCALFSLL